MITIKNIDIVNKQGTIIFTRNFEDLMLDDKYYSLISSLFTPLNKFLDNENTSEINLLQLGKDYFYFKQYFPMALVFIIHSSKKMEVLDLQEIFEKIGLYFNKFENKHSLKDNSKDYFINFLQSIADVNQFPIEESLTD